MPNLSKLISVFEETRRALDNPDNNFVWSSWANREAAVDEILAELQSGALPSELVLQGLCAYWPDSRS